jgi:hypothetical protein
LNSLSPITHADLKALADLANAKLLPATPYAFTPFLGADQLGLPADVKVAAVYGGAGQFPDGRKQTIWLFGYKIIDGVKNYSWSPLIKAFLPQAGAGAFSLAWTWADAITNPPDGYLVVIPKFESFIPASVNPFAPLKNLYSLVWQDIGAATNFAEDGSFSSGLWFVDEGLLQGTDASFGVVPQKQLPCALGTWTKTLNLIRHDLVYGTDILNSSSAKILGRSAINSGPSCVCVGPKLAAWMPRANFSGGGYSQCYDQIQFYFRAADAPGGIDIAVQNRLLDFAVTSDPIAAPTHTAHWALTLVGCSDGHIKIADFDPVNPGMGTVRFEADVVAGATVDCSFDIFDAVGYNPSPGIPRALDCIFTTAGTNVSASALGIELSNDVQLAIVPDSFFELSFNGLTSCGQLVVTENNNVPGIWVAKTLLSNGQMTYLSQDLPQYQIANSIDSRRTARNNALPYMSIVDNRGALSPVLRDTDFTPDLVAGHAVNGSKAWQMLAVKNVTTLTNTDIIPPYEPDEVLQPNTYVLFVPFGATEIRFLTSDPNAAIYIDKTTGHTPTLAANDGNGPGAAWFIVPVTPADYGAIWHFAIYNPTAQPINVTTKVVTITGDIADTPNGTFFPTQKDDAGNIIPQTEKYSYHFADSAPDAPPLPIPLFGYCVFEIAIRRQPVNGVAPSTGTLALPVDIGIMDGFGFDVPGTFTRLLSTAIPAGQSGIVVSTFLPVLSGTLLSYQCAEIVNVRAGVNFQPQSQSNFVATNTTLNGQPFTVGYFSGAPFFLPNDTSLCQAGVLFDRNFTFEPILLPVSIDLYNGVQSALSAMIS